MDRTKNADSPNFNQDNKLSLLSPIKLGNHVLRNRVVMAPLTRRRATADHVPTEIMATYYGQRASAGLIIAEATNISPQAVGYMHSPGIYSEEQIYSWKTITQAVHEKGGVIFLQLWHVGRVSHPSLQAGGRKPVSASAIAASGVITTPKGQQRMVEPKELSIPEISQIKKDYTIAAQNAMRAGFDGVEIHGANGYLPDQFLHDGSNVRTDKYGGSIQNRSRFILEVLSDCCKAIGPERVGVRLSPSGIYKDMYDTQPVALYEYLIAALNDYNPVYLHLMEPYVALEPEEKYRQYLKTVTPFFRKYFKGPVMTNVNFDRESGNAVIKKGHADMVAFGKLFISNPDLVERFATNGPLSHWDDKTFYHGKAKGYIDYPLMDQLKEESGNSENQ